MRRLRQRLVVLLIHLFFCAAFSLVASGQDAPHGLLNLVSSESFNVVVTVGDREASNAFYGEILGLKKSGVWDTMPENGTMDIYAAGQTRLKLISFPRHLPKHAGGPDQARGLRSMTVLLDDEPGVTERLGKRGYKVPQFKAVENSGLKHRFLRDPDDNQIELVFRPKGSEAGDPIQFAVGITVADAQASRAFYGEVLGLAEQPPKKLDDGRSIYSFKRGTGLIQFWQTQEELPAWGGYHGDGVGIRYIQFPVTDIARAHAYFQSAKADIVRAPFEFAAPRTWLMFVRDPDGVWIEFPGRPPRK